MSESEQGEQESSRAGDTLWSIKHRWAAISYDILGAVIYPVTQHKIGAAIVFVLVFATFHIVNRQAITPKPTYTADATVLLAQPAYQTRGSSSEMMPRLLDTPVYVTLLKSDAVLQQVCDTVLSEHPEDWKEIHEAGRLTPSALAGSFTISTEVVGKTAQAVRYSNLLYLAVTHDEPELAYQLIKAWLDACEQKVMEIDMPGADATIEFLQTEYERVRGELFSREEELLAAQTAFDVPLHEMQLTGMRTRLTLITSGFHVVETSTEGVNGGLPRTLGNETMLADAIPVIDSALAKAQRELASVETLLAEEERFYLLETHASKDALAILDKDPEDAPGFVDQVPNPVWENLRTEQDRLKSEIEGLQGRRAQLETEKTQLETTIAALQKEVDANVIKQNQLTREIVALESAFTAMAQQRENVVALETSRKLENSSTLVVASEPILPTAPNATITRGTRLAFILLICTIVAIAWANIIYEFDRVLKLRKTGAA